MHNLFGLMLLAVTLPAAACFAARPLIVDDTDPIDPGAYQFDFGVEYAAAERGNFGFPTNLTYGIGHNTQVGIGSGVTVQNNGADGRVRGLNDSGFATKTKFYDQARRRNRPSSPAAGSRSDGRNNQSAGCRL